ncbi:MAG: threonine synthase [Gemmatimonadetes bacterium]|nr:threonine synthase [Gemmatimonadota bacterium]
MTYHWSLVCSASDETHDASGLPTVSSLGEPWLVTYSKAPDPDVKARLASRAWDMWRYREWMPLDEDEEPVTLGEGCTPLLRVPSLERASGVETVWIKDEGQNPCGSFKSRGLSAAVTRAVRAGVRSFVIPTAGNAGVALAAYGRQAGTAVRVYAPRTTPLRILEQIELFGADLQLLDGHIGDCGKAAREFAASGGAFDVSTLREPYRIEGKKTMGIEIAEQLGWSLPDCIIYPTGGGTGLIGMWKAFKELRDAGWIAGPLPRLYSVQSDGCAPVVRAFDAGASVTEPWQNPETIAYGLRVPGPLGGKVMLRTLKECGGKALAVSDPELQAAAARIGAEEGIDMCPEGGAAVVALEKLAADGTIGPADSVVVFNTGAGWLYR